MITSLVMTYISMGYSVEEARACAVHEIATKKKLEKEPVVIAKPKAKPSTINEIKARKASQRRSRIAHCASVTDHKGVRYDCMASMARAWGLPPTVLIIRIKQLKWDVERALTTPVGAVSPTQYVTKVCRDHEGNEFPNQAAMARHWNIPPNTLRSRLAYHWPLALALTEPVVHYVKRGEA